MLAERRNTILLQRVEDDIYRLLDDLKENKSEERAPRQQAWRASLRTSARM